MSTQLPEHPPQKQDDPLESLHRMSRTAGLGTTEYVAVNVTAVVTLLLGLASGLAVMGPILLILPAVTLVLGIVAIRQVVRSAGTQTGKGIAILGMITALACVGVVGGKEVMRIRGIAADQGEITQVIESLGQNLRDANYDAAWAQFGPRFKDRFTKEKFVDTWSRVQASPYYGQIKSMRSNGIIDVSSDPASGVPYARGVVIVERTTSQGDAAPDRRELIFAKDEQGHWVVNDIDAFFSGPQGAN